MNDGLMRFKFLQSCITKKQNVGTICFIYQLRLKSRKIVLNKQCYYVIYFVNYTSRPKQIWREIGLV